MFNTCVWHNEPQQWSLHDQTLHVTTDMNSDFWRETHYGFTRDSGHFFAREWQGDFTASLRVRGNYKELYDQAGIMVRIDESRWIKAGIELSDGAACIGSVLTVDRCDWSTAAYCGEASDLYLRVTVADGILRLQSSEDGVRWPLLRLCPFPKAQSYQVGPMCCTPERKGLEVRFSEFLVGPPLARDLHDLT
jgi:regulation of enolase protein 1 (concanavalin A-like superfamily)